VLLLLQFYGLELHYLTHSGILHIAVFVTMCEVYMGIKPHFNLWNYFFRVQLQSGLDAEVAVWGCVDISIRSGPGVDQYFCLSMSNPPVGWRKERFFCGTTPTRCFPCSRVSTSCLDPTRGTRWLSETAASYNLCVMSSNDCSEMG
jgi:hypothetical protein